MPSNKKLLCFKKLLKIILILLILTILTLSLISTLTLFKNKQITAVILVIGNNYQQSL